MPLIETSRRSQFAATPRFSSRPRPPTRSEPTPPRQDFANALRAALRTHDNVQETPDNEDDEEMLDTEQANAVPTTEDATDWTTEVAFSPKRRRLDDPVTQHSPARPTFQPPGAPASASRRTSRFVHPSPSPAPSISSVLTSDTPAVTANRPSFLRPTPAPSEPTEPLPEAFSPHRRGQKFVPGGLASQVQSWVIEAGQSAVQSRRQLGWGRRGAEGNEGLLARVAVRKVSGYGMGPWLVEGRDGEGMLLVRNERETVEEGMAIGVKAPVWEVVVDGGGWRVGVDWKVL